MISETQNFDPQVNPFKKRIPINVNIWAEASPKANLDALTDEEAYHEMHKLEQDANIACELLNPNQDNACPAYSNDLPANFYDELASTHALEQSEQYKVQKYKGTKSRLEEARASLPNPHKWALVYCTDTEYLKFQMLSPNKVKRIDKFVFLDTYEFADEIKELGNLSSLIPIDVAHWRFDEDPKFKDNLKKMGALYAKEFDLNPDETGFYWFLPKGDAKRLKDFDIFTNQYQNQVLDRKLNKIETLKAQGEQAKQVDASGYLPFDVLKSKLGDKLERYPKSVIYTCNHLYMMSKGKFYNKQGYINFTNKEIAKGTGYSERTVTYAIGVLKEIGLITTETVYNEHIGRTERRISLNIEHGKCVEVPIFLHEGVGHTTSLYASFVSFRNSKAVKDIAHNQILDRKFLKDVGEELGIRGANLNRVLRELKKAGILEQLTIQAINPNTGKLENKQTKALVFTDKFKIEYTAVYGAYLNRAPKPKKKK